MAWGIAVEQAGGEAALLAAVVAYAAHCVADQQRPKRFDRWLASGEFRSFLPPPKPADAAWSGPAHVRLAVANAMGEGGVTDYLSVCGWSEVPPAIVAPFGFTADKLLAQSMQDREALDATFIGENRDVVAFRICRPQTNHSRRPKPIFGDDIVEHRERVAIERVRSLTKSVVVENGRKFPLEIPSGKER